MDYFCDNDNSSRVYLEFKDKSIDPGVTLNFELTNSYMTIVFLLDS